MMLLFLKGDFMERYKKVKLASILGIIGNLFLFIIKLLVGFMSKSEAMIADTFNSGGDIFSSLITFIGNKIASVPSDEDHNLGHGKAEYIYSMLISIFMIIVSFTIIKSSIISLIYNKKYIFSKYLIIVCIVTITIKLFLYFYTNKIARSDKNLLMEANSKDHINDIFLTSLNLFSVLFAKYGIYYFDGIIGLFISMWIIITSLKIFKQSYDVLMDKTISNDTRNKVLDIIKGFEEIKKVQHFNATPVGYKYQISLTIFVDGNMSTYDSHQVADNLEKEIIATLDEIYLAVIHVNPI